MRLSEVIRSVRQKYRTLAEIETQIDNLRFAQGMVLSALHADRSPSSLSDSEFQVFSQFGEDGIIQRLTSVIPVSHRTFIEFGAGDFFESNCRFLMMKDGWQGFVIDSSESNIQRMRNAHFYWKHALTATCAFVTRENINELLARSSFPGDVGILSIDIDGNDCHVLAAIEAVSPRIVICEYNALFGRDRKITIPYQADFQRSRAHHSNLYWGASLAAIAHIADGKGYSLVGTNSAGNNAFFVRRDVLRASSGIAPVSPTDAYTPARFRESRDERGSLSFLDAGAGRKAIQGLPVLNVETGLLETL